MAANNPLKGVKINLQNVRPPVSDSMKRPEVIFQPSSISKPGLLQSAIESSNKMDNHVNHLNEVNQASRGSSMQQFFLKQENLKRQQQNSIFPPSTSINQTLNAEGTFQGIPFQPDGSIFARNNVSDFVGTTKQFPSRDLSVGMDFNHMLMMDNQVSILQQPGPAFGTRLKSFSRQNSSISMVQMDDSTPRMVQNGFSTTTAQQQLSGVKRNFGQSEANFGLKGGLKTAGSIKVQNNASQDSFISKRSIRDIDQLPKVQPAQQPLTHKRSTRETATNEDVSTVRARQENVYVQKAVEGKRMRKTKDQMQVLMVEFNKNYKWTYEQSVRIGERIGMTFHQVSKWNWDQRKKQGIPTERIKRQ